MPKPTAQIRIHLSPNWKIHAFLAAKYLLQACALAALGGAILGSFLGGFFLALTALTALTKYLFPNL